MTRALCLGAFATILAAPGAAGAGVSCAQSAPAPGLAPDIVARAAQPHDFPSFCSIPKIPTDVRGASDWKAAVLDTRLAGARLQRQTAASTWTLDRTDDFAAGARSEAAPPPPMNPASEADTATFAKSLRDRATPPPRPH
ncbi:MAG TPA: hypothetical protein VF459_05100 [Caulobacteraceae bacterium]